MAKIMTALYLHRRMALPAGAESFFAVGEAHGSARLQIFPYQGRLKA